MESKTKHRILGIVVVAGLAVLMYPFMQGGSRLQSDQVLVKSPAFPDQAIQVTSTESDDASLQQPDGVIKPEDGSTADATAPSMSHPPEASDGAAIKDPAAPVGKPEETSAEKPAAESSSLNTEIDAPASSAGDEPAIVKNEEPPAKIVKKSAKKLAKKKVATKAERRLAKAAKPVLQSRFASQAAIAANKQMPIDSNGLLQLKKAAYVIQLGSFKQKTNALKLVNKLRAKGYRAFIQRVDLSSGENTRVFVGPEHQQASARLVATSLQKDMRLHGIVISYQPFSL